MTPAPFTAADAYEERISQETYQALTSAIEKKASDEQEHLRQLNDRLSEVERANSVGVQQAEDQARLAIAKIHQRSLWSIGTAWLIAAAFLVAASVVIGNGTDVGILLAIALVTGAFVYVKRTSFAVVTGGAGFIVAIVAAYLTNGSTGSFGSSYTPNVLWGTYAVLLILVAASFPVAFYVLRRSKDKEREQTTRVEAARAAAVAMAESMRRQIDQETDRVGQRLHALDSVVPLWRAGGPQAEQAAAILVENGLNEEAGAIRAHQRKLTQIRYQDREVSNRAEVLRQAQEAMHRATQCPQCSAPRTGQPQGPEGLVRCDYCGLVYKPMDVHRFA